MEFNETDKTFLITKGQIEYIKNNKYRILLEIQNQIPPILVIDMSEVNKKENYKILDEFELIQRRSSLCKRIISII